MRALTLVIALGALCLLFPVPGNPQSTDGFHAFQVIPVVVDNDSFKTRLTFSNESHAGLRIRAFYLPGEGTSQLAELDCGTFNVTAWQAKTFASIRDLCPLPGGTQFGTLYTRIDNAADLVGPYSYAAFSRVENPQGMGFSVEAFPAHTFVGSTTVVAGLRRRAAKSGMPAFQTNCFVGSLHRETSTGAPPTGDVGYLVLDGSGAEIGRGVFALAQGKLVRIMDIFGHAGVPDGDVEDATVEFYPWNSPGVVTFCTVQDNTNYSADFRIGKQIQGYTYLNVVDYGNVLFSNDDHVLRVTSSNFDLELTNGLGSAEMRMFSIPAGSSSNAHMIQFRRPDYVSCKLMMPGLNIPATNLEMRLLQGGVVIAGGDGVTAFGPVYTGDKFGTIVNGRYVLEVERAEVGASGEATNYLIHCRSGSGHSAPVLVRTGGPNQF